MFQIETGSVTDVPYRCSNTSGGHYAHHGFVRSHGGWSLIVPVVPASAAQDRIAEDALAVAERKAECPGGKFDFASTRASESARRGLVSVVVGAPEGGGYVMIMAYTGSAWGVL